MPLSPRTKSIIRSNNPNISNGGWVRSCGRRDRLGGHLWEDHERPGPLRQRLDPDFWERGLVNDRAGLMKAIKDGIVKPVCPILMTIATDVVGLFPIMWSAGTGSDVMKRIGTPLVVGVVTSGIVVLCLYPVAYYLWKLRELPPVSSEGGESNV